MADNFYAYGTDASSRIGIMKAYARMGAFPLDNTSVFKSVADLQAYINVTGSYAYAGQIVAVANGTTESTNGAKDYTLYVIRSDKSIQEIGKNLVFESSASATAYITQNTVAFSAGQLITVKKTGEGATGYDLYIVTDPATGAVQKASFDAATDLPTMEWSSIDGRPDSSVADIDVAAALVKNAALTYDADKAELKVGDDVVAVTGDITWTNVKAAGDTPTTVEGYGITDALTTADATETATSGKLLKVNSDNKLPASITGDADTVDGKHAADFAEASHTHGTDDITDVSWAKVTNTPTTIEGYGITDAASASDLTEAPTAGKALKVNAEGKLPASITGDAATVGGMAADEFATAAHSHGDGEITDVSWTKVQNTPTTIEGYGITDAYTKTEVDSKLSSVYRYKGSVSSFNALPTENLTVGDVYNVENESKLTKKLLPVTVVEVEPKDILGVVNLYLSDESKAALNGYTGTTANVYDSSMNLLGTGVDIRDYNNYAYLSGYRDDLTPGQYYFECDAAEYNTTEVAVKTINAGDNVAWTGSSWDVLAGTDDLSGYFEKSEVVTTAEANKVLKLNADAKLPADITGDAATVGGKAASDFAEAAHSHGDAEITDVAWGKVTGTPTDLAGYGITDAVNSSEVVTTAEANKILKLNADSKLPADITGDAATVGGKAASAFAEAAHTHGNDEITDVAWGKVTGTPTDLAGYGITDAAKASDLSETAEAGKALKVNADGKLHVDIVGDASTVGGKAPSAFAEAEHSHGNDDITDVDWSKVQNTPTTVSEYGITDALTTADATDVATSGKLLKVNSDNKLPVSITGDAATVGGKAASAFAEASHKHGDADITDVSWGKVTGAPTTVAGYGITDAYTKTEVDAKLSSVYTYKGTVETASALPTEGVVVGDVYNVTTKSTGNGVSVNAGDNVAWTEDGWDVLAGIVNLESYATKEDVADAMESVHTHDNKALLDGLSTDSDGRLNNGSTVVANYADLSNVIQMSATEPATLPVGGLWLDTSING